MGHEEERWCKLCGHRWPEPIAHCEPENVKSLEVAGIVEKPEKPEDVDNPHKVS